MLMVSCLLLSADQAVGFLFPKGLFGTGPTALDARVQTRKSELVAAFRALKKNGKDATLAKRAEVAATVAALEKLNPTARPAYSPRMNGFWR